MIKEMAGIIKESILLTIAMLGLYLIGYGLYMIYVPLSYIYGGIVMIFFANIGASKTVK